MKPISYENRGGEIWEQCESGWRELFAQDAILRLEHYEKRIESLSGELEANTVEFDSLGVTGSDFKICIYCQAQSGPGKLDVGIPHADDCFLSTLDP